MTLHYITLHYITLRCITLHHITSHYITLQYITLHYIALHCIAFHCIAWHCMHACIAYIHELLCRIHICVHRIDVYIYICISTNVYEQAHAYAYVNLHAHAYVYVYIYIYMWIHVCSEAGGVLEPEPCFGKGGFPNPSICSLRNPTAKTGPVCIATWTVVFPNLPPSIITRGSKYPMFNDNGPKYY